MSTQQQPPPSSSSSSQKLDFAPLHRTDELENIHESVIQNDPHPQQQNQLPSTRKILVKHMTVIGDGSDIDKN